MLTKKRTTGAMSKHKIARNARPTKPGRTATMQTDSKRLRDAVTKRIRKTLAASEMLVVDRKSGRVWTKDVGSDIPTSSVLPLGELARLLGLVTNDEFKMLTKGKGQKMPMPMSMSTAKVNAEKSVKHEKHSFCAYGRRPPFS